ncbi:hypothetical protein L596_012523 [Steinernema carpocapsae]|uniref:7TM GPCR serpentine receptor class x (Srx) domain-containing protein n=1 Tax=Steinernema carpocapsae TaxID=34508 RepID=A0A4U5NXC7_STECR|nr:hypothetical protein L596_012523 [Steinernema carpocapsae]
MCFCFRKTCLRGVISNQQDWEEPHGFKRGWQEILIIDISISTAMDSKNATAAADQLFDNRVSALIMMTVGGLGLMVNLHVILALRRLKTFGYAFGRICMSHTVANFGNAFVFSCYVAPISLFYPEFHKHYIGVRAGQVLILFWNASVLSHLLTAVNRCVVMFFPLKVEHIFTKRVTDVTLAVLWIFSICQVIPYFSTECLFDYHIETFTFLFGSSTCSVVIGTYADYYFSILMICAIASLDFLTFIKIHTMNKETKMTTEMKKRRRREIKFFFQALCQGLAFMTELISFFYINFQFKNKWMVFVFTTFAWITVHMLDGLIVIAFNKEIRTFRVITGNSTLGGSSTGDGKTMTSGNTKVAITVVKN